MAQTVPHDLQKLKSYRGRKKGNRIEWMGRKEGQGENSTRERKRKIKETNTETRKQGTRNGRQEM
jgi:hypothetical protein